MGRAWGLGSPSESRNLPMKNRPVWLERKQGTGLPKVQGQDRVTCRVACLGRDRLYRKVQQHMFQSHRQCLTVYLTAQMSLVFQCLVFLPSVRGKSICPPTTLTAVLEREMQTRPPPPIAHHRHQMDK